MEQREIDNMLLSMIQKHFPSLPLSDEYTDWGKWLGFARAVYESGRASPASATEGFALVPVVPTVAERDAEIIEQCRINGMGAEREAALLGEVERQSAALKLARQVLMSVRETSSSTRLRRIVNDPLAAINEVIGE